MMTTPEIPVRRDLPAFTIERCSALPAAVAFDRLVDWEQHSVPGTAVSVESGPAGVGQRFTARTSLLGLGFDDTMIVTEFTPAKGCEAGLCSIAKQGPVLFGDATIVVRPVDQGCAVTWTERLYLGTGLSAEITARIGTVTGPWVFGRLIAQLLR